MAKEIENVMITFQVVPNSEVAPNSYQLVGWHMACGIEIEDVHRTACLPCILDLWE